MIALKLLCLLSIVLGVAQAVPLQHGDFYRAERPIEPEMLLYSARRAAGLSAAPRRALSRSHRRVFSTVSAGNSPVCALEWRTSVCLTCAAVSGARDAFGMCCADVEDAFKWCQQIHILTSQTD